MLHCFHSISSYRPDAPRYERNDDDDDDNVSSKQRPHIADINVDQDGRKFTRHGSTHIFNSLFFSVRLAGAHARMRSVLGLVDADDDGGRLFQEQENNNSTRVPSGSTTPCCLPELKVKIRCRVAQKSKIWNFEPQRAPGSGLQTDR